ncbi:MAG: BatD family protein [Candidatus Margulisbacteria bacterium]|nr:BatD family protein [Candidatus Margulisiibacteriota bacterium]MBU1616166.1 BatD family protein [Candidatus Margulisiibacteriota bacterium]
MKVKIALLALVLLALPLFAEEVSIKGTVDKTTVALDDTVSYTVTISGGGEDVPPPSQPKFVNLAPVSNYRTSNISIINGQANVSSSMTYALKPQAVGAASIGSAQLSYNGRTYWSDPIEVKVTPATGASRSRRSLSPSAMGADPWEDVFDKFFKEPIFVRPEPVKDPIKVKMTVSRTNPYVNQLVLLTFTFYRRINLLEAPIYMPPSTTGFWSVNLPVSSQQRQETIDGVNYLAQDFRTAIFPIADGRQVIKEGSLRARINAGAPSLFKTDPVTLQVRPLPEAGKPADFGGSVGRYKLSVAPSVKEVERGKPFTIVAKVFGEGNIQSVSEPVLADGEGYKKLSSSSNEKVVPGNLSVSGSKTFEIAVLPLKEGTLALPPLSFSYFDPGAEKYVQLNSQPLAIKVLHSSSPLPKELNAGSQNGPEGSVKISFNWRKPLRWLFGLVVSPIFIVGFGLTVGLFLIFVVWQRFKKLQGADPIRLRRSRALRVARGRLKRAQQLLKEQKLKECVGELHESVSHYLGDKYNFSATGATTDEVKELLSDKGISSEEQTEIEAFFNECDLARFTPSTLDTGMIDKLLRQAERLIVLIESNK